MQIIEQTLDSREVAEMVGKEHHKLLRDIRRYENQLTESKIGFSEFFNESEYRDSTGRMLPCYRITKKGCEFIAHKLTGQKGTEFTARYINRFHEMQDILSEQNPKPERPWFIRSFLGSDIILERDFITITGIDIRKSKAFYNPSYFKGGKDFNGVMWTKDKDLFKQTYGFEYGEEKVLLYFYPGGALKALHLLRSDRTIEMKENAYRMIMDGITAVPEVDSKQLEEKQEIALPVSTGEAVTLQLTITVNPSGISVGVNGKE